MSDIINCYDYGFGPDRYTTFIVYAFMKIPSNSYFSYMTYFPKDIASITINYIGEHFMIYRCSYQWTVNNPLLVSMCAANNGEEYESPTFEMENVTWKLRAYPNGDVFNSEGAFNLFVDLVSMPSQWEQLYTFIIFECEQFDQCRFMTWRLFTKKEKTFGWPDQKLSFQQVSDYLNIHNDTAQLTFNVMINITRIMLKNPIDYGYDTLYNFHGKTFKEMMPESFIWKIDEQLLKEMQKTKREKSFHSPIFHDTWCLVVFPKDAINVTLQLCAFPANTDVFVVSYEICLKGRGIGSEIKCKGVYEFAMNDDQVSYFAPNQGLMEFEEFVKCEEFIIEVNIYEKENENKNIANDKWMQYTKQMDVIKGKKMKDGTEKKSDIVTELRVINDQVDTLLESRIK